MYDKTWYIGILQDVDQEQVDVSIQIMHPNKFSFICFSHKKIIYAGYQHRILFCTIEAPWLISACGFYYVSIRSITKLLKRFKEIISTNVAVCVET